MKLNHLGVSLAGAIAITVAGATPALAVDPSPAVMDLTGTPQLGEYMTVAFKNEDGIGNGSRPVGDYLVIWMCPNKDVLPRARIETGECVSPTLWQRSAVSGWSIAYPQTVALSMKWLLADEDVPGLNPANDVAYLDSNSQPITVGAPDQDAGGWCAFEGWYIIVNDFGSIGGTGANGHSNWSEAFSNVGCSEDGSGSAESGAGTLPDTGASSTAGIIAGSLGLAAIAGGLLLVRARRLRANVN